MDVTSRLSTVHIDKVSSSPATLKLPPLFSLTPNSTARSGNFYKRQAQVHTNVVSENLPHEQTESNNQVNTPQTGQIWFLPLADNIYRSFSMCCVTPSFMFCRQ